MFYKQILLFAILFALIFSFSYSSISKQDIDNNSASASSLVTNPIKITNNIDLQNYFGGSNGTQDKPYVLSNNNFINDNINYQIEIDNTNLFIIIKNNTINYALKEGIILNNDSNILIEDNHFYKNTGDAILINNCSSVSFIHNFIEYTMPTPTYTDAHGLQNYPFSVDVAYSTNITVNNNKLSNNNDGIWFWGGDSNSQANNNLIQHNIFEGLGAGGNTAYETHNISFLNNMISNVRYGVWLTGDGGPTLVSNNSIIDSEKGMRIGFATDTEIENNIFENNQLVGIELYLYAYNSNIFNNLFKDNSIGISIDGSGHNIHRNDFINNGINGFSKSNSNITISMNYWSDYNLTRENNNGIYETAYKLNGDVTLYDNSPLVNQTFHALVVTVSTTSNDKNSPFGSTMVIVSSLFLVVIIKIKKRSKNEK